MSQLHRIELGCPAVLEFRGPDAVRFLNGQLTQDVRRVVGSAVCLASCVTDAKGRLQHRVRILENGGGGLWVTGRGDEAQDLELRITRYLIADEVEVEDLSGRYRLVHFIGLIEPAPEGVLARESERFGVAGTDWWMPADREIPLPESDLLGGAVLEAFRIGNAVPAWGAELVAGMLPPEAGLEATDISYTKGCYIGQEVISRIKSAGKVNRRLVRLVVESEAEGSPGELIGADGKAAGEVTSLSPVAEGGLRPALGYLKRTAAAGPLVLELAGGGTVPVRVVAD
jgi:tRNA-modifying protein YgfZ